MAFRLSHPTRWLDPIHSDPRTRTLSFSLASVNSGIERWSGIPISDDNGRRSDPTTSLSESRGSSGSFSSILFSRKISWKVSDPISLSCSFAPTLSLFHISTRPAYAFFRVHSPSLGVAASGLSLADSVPTISLRTWDWTSCGVEDKSGLDWVQQEEFLSSSKIELVEISWIWEGWRGMPFFSPIFIEFLYGNGLPRFESYIEWEWDTSLTL